MIKPTRLNKEEIHNLIFFCCVIAIAFILPLSKDIIGIVSIILVANWLVSGNFKEKFNLLKKNEIFLLFSGFYFLLILSFLYSQNLSYGLRVLERNIAWIIYPTIIFSSTYLEKHKFKLVLASFVAGCAVAVLICLASAFYHYSIFKESKYFFYHQFGSYIGIHAVYFSFYLSIALFITVYFYFKDREFYTSKMKLLTGILVALFLIAIVLLSSKIIIASLFVIFNMIVLRVFMKKRKIKRGLPILIVTNILIILLILNIPFIRERFILAIDANLELVKKDDYSGIRRYSGPTIRLILWKFAFEITNEEKSWLFGNGIGDARELQRLKALEHNLFTGKPEDYRGWPDLTKYNAHNQYVQYLLSLGLIGLSYFLFLLAVLFKSAYKSGEDILVFTLLIFCIFSFSECTMERYRGIVFSIFLISLLATRLSKNCLHFS